MERISKSPTPDCPLCGWSHKDHPMRAHEWVTKTGECTGEDRVPCLLRQLAAANERVGRLEKAMIEWEGDWFTGGKTKIAADNRLRELLIEMGIIDRILGGA